MKEQIALRPELELLKIRYPHIHTDDARHALARRVAEKANRQARTVEGVMKAFDSVFLAVLADVPPEQWTDSAWHEIGVRVRAGKARNFWKRLMDRRRVALFTPTDLFLLENWRVLRSGNPDGRPGLREWHPLAVMDLLRHRGLYCGSSEDWYHGRRLSLGLSPSLYTYPKP